jgi:sigma-B regulation protein RsbU (phosphoserine phosphatase)
MSQNFRRPDELLAGLNTKLSDLLSTQMFVSAFYLIIDLKEKMIHYSNAGHPYPLLYRARERDVIDLQADGTLLSVLPDSQYCAEKKAFHPGDRVVLYTDGVFDMKNKSGEYVPMDFVRSLTVRNARLDGYDFIEELLAKLYRFGEIERFDDDINLIIVDFFNETAVPAVKESRARN